MRSARLFRLIILTSLFLSATPVTAYVDKFKTCQSRIQALLNGTSHTIQSTIGNLTNATIWDHNYIYTGPARELDPTYPRNQFLTLTYKGITFHLPLPYYFASLIGF
jgi:hypothetical protein